MYTKEETLAGGFVVAPQGDRLSPHAEWFMSKEAAETVARRRSESFSGETFLVLRVVQKHCVMAARNLEVYIVGKTTPLGKIIALNNKSDGSYYWIESRDGERVETWPKKLVDDAVEWANREAERIKRERV